MESLVVNRKVRWPAVRTILLLHVEIDILDIQNNWNLFLGYHVL